MKILKKGQTAQDRLVGQKGTCFYCKAQIEVELGDRLDFHASQDQRESDSYSLLCPTHGCNGTITVFPRSLYDNQWDR